MSQPIRIAINGYGRIGRNVLRALYERPEYHDALRIVAINDLGGRDVAAHLTQYDSTHGAFLQAVTVEEGAMQVGGDTIAMYAEADPEALPWGDLDIDIVFECTGRFTSRDAAAAHLRAGARRVLVSAPAKGADKTVVYGVNHEELAPEHRVVSNASCTTNCLAPMLKPLSEILDIEHGLMTTIHAYTNDQNLTDVAHKDLYRARSATQSLIPTKTGAAAAIGLVLPALDGRLDGLAVRVPTLNVSLVDLSLSITGGSSVEAVNELMAKAAAEDPYGVLAFNDKPLVSIDFNHSTTSCNFDANHTRVAGHLVKVLAWYDNEWGFSNRMLDTARVMAALGD